MISRRSPSQRSPSGEEKTGWIRRLLAAPVFEDEEKTRVARLLNIALLSVFTGVVLMIVAILAFVGVSNAPEDLFTLLSAVVMGMATTVLLVLARRGHVKVASAVLLSLLWVIITYWVCAVVGISSDSSALIYAFIVALAGVLLGGRAAIAFASLSVLTVVAAYLAEESGLLVVVETPVSIMDAVATTLPLLLTGLLLRHAVTSMAQALERARRNERAQVEAVHELEALRASLEAQVSDRTRGLERRSVQLQAAAEVGRAASSILEPERLMWQLAELIGERFELYHVGLFQTDATGRWLEYRAGAGEGGRALAEQGFRLEADGPSMVGRCALHRQARVAQDVGIERERIDHPLVPATRSEAALPLVARGQVIGVLSVQSRERHAFDPDTVNALQTVADQVAVALENARLFAESQDALEATRRAYGELSRQAWTELLRARGDWGYRYAHQSVVAAEGEWQPEMLQALSTGQATPGLGSAGSGSSVGDAEGPALALPLKVRDQVVGALGFYKGQQDEAWTVEEQTLLEAVVGQLGVTLESAQLFEETQRRAAREQAIRQVTERMRRAVDVEAILQTTIAELAQALGVARAYVRLGVETESQSPERDLLLSGKGTGS